MNSSEIHPVIIRKVENLYYWLDAQLASMGRSCRACGGCCDFETFGHRLYITTPELIYFRHFTGPEIKQMSGGVCPYRVDKKCTVYPYRFSGCRIFDCGTNSEAQNQLCEEILRRFKELCDTQNIEYRYLYLKDALASLKD